MRKISCAVFLLFLSIHSGISWAKQCLYVSSYHAGYEWDDGIYSAVKKTLAGECTLEKFYLDTKRNPKPEWAKWRAKEAMKLIKKMEPDVIIAADDNASRYLVMPYLKDHKIPVVFCGINWSMEEYGYPYKNTTGMLEISPVKPMIKQLKVFSPNASRGLFLSSDVVTEHKDYKYYKKKFADNDIALDAVFVSHFRQWIASYKEAQAYDFIFLGNNAGINDWYRPEAERIVAEFSNKISVTTYEWMLPYTALAFTKLPEEQGAWAAKVALSVLRGIKISQIPVIFNRKWDMWINTHLISKLKLDIPFWIYRRAKHY